MEETRDPMWDPLQAQGRVFRAAEEEMGACLDAFLREILRPEVLQALLSGMAGTSPSPGARGTGGIQDPYRVLGLEKTAADGEVKKRFRELLRRLHPDTAGVKGTEFLLQLVLAAYQQIGQKRGWR